MSEFYLETSTVKLEWSLEVVPFGRQGHEQRTDVEMFEFLRINCRSTERLKSSVNESITSRRRSHRKARSCQRDRYRTCRIYGRKFGILSRCLFYFPIATNVIG